MTQQLIKYNKDNPLRCFFAFEGYNSQGMALNRLKSRFPDFDWMCVGRSEIEKYAIIAANAVSPENKDKNFGDISKIDWSQVPDFDLFTYSWPCTQVSIAGTQAGFKEGSGTSSSLLWECKRAIEIKRPKYLLMENVKALVSKKFMPDFQKWLDWLTAQGYTTYWKVLNAKDYGIPQNRERVFAVSFLTPRGFEWPKPVPLTKCLADVLERDVDESYYLKSEAVNKILSQMREDNAKV